MTTPTQRQIIFENNNYYIIVGESQVLEGAQVYLVLNRHTDVIEAEEQMLPRVIDYATQLDTACEELISELNLFSLSDNGSAEGITTH